MKIGVIGAGHIGGNVARQALKAGHEVKLSFSREPAALDRLARELGPRASTGTPSDAVEFGEIVVLSVPDASPPPLVGMRPHSPPAMIFRSNNPADPTSALVRALRLPDLTGVAERGGGATASRRDCS